MAAGPSGPDNPLVRDSFRFVHRLTRDAAYGGLLDSNRRRLHGATADVLGAQHIEGAAGEGEVLSALVLHLEAAQRWTEAHTRLCSLLNLQSNLGRLANWAQHEAEAVRLWALARASDQRLPARSPALSFACGTRALLSGEPERAQAEYEASRQLASESGERTLEARALAKLGELASTQGCRSEAQQLMRRALDIAHELGADALEAPVYNSLGNVLADGGNLPAALEAYERGLAAAERCGHRRAAGVISGNIGVAQLHLGRLDEARGCFQHELEAARSTEDWRNEGTALTHLGELYARLGDFAAARACLREDLQRARALGDRASEGIVLGGLGEVALAAGELDEARRLLQQALELAQQVQDWRVAGHWQGNLGEAERRSGRLAEARAALEEGRVALEQSGDRLLLGQLLLVYARLACDEAAVSPAAATELLVEAAGLLDAAENYFEETGAAANPSLASQRSALRARLIAMG